MKPPAPLFELPYQHNRRKHRHRCRCCLRIVEAGEQVLMARVPTGFVVGQNKTWVLHLACGDKQHGKGPWLHRDALRQSGVEHLRNSGWTKLHDDPRARLTGNWQRIEDGTFVPDLSQEADDVRLGYMTADQLESLGARMRAEYARAMHELGAMPPFADLMGADGNP